MGEAPVALPLCHPPEAKALQPATVKGPVVLATEVLEFSFTVPL